MIGITGRDDAARQLKRLLREARVDVRGLVACQRRQTSVKIRIVSGQQQIVRLDRETKENPDARTSAALLAQLDIALGRADAVIVGDYGKGVVTQSLLDRLRRKCRQRGLWLSLDPKPTRALKLEDLSLITPNRREAFGLAGVSDSTYTRKPLEDRQLLLAAGKLVEMLHPEVLLITLGELGMLLCRNGESPVHIDTVAKEVFDVSGAGDTVIASFTIARAAGATPLEAAVFSNHAAGVVVSKFGTATVVPKELHESFTAS
jgi:D-beta-D-heptose 7-phosphate kinase/D-beta-D-heptose 1-phosphate adenosyltransferase